jgi:benzoate-CoA ligase
MASTADRYWNNQARSDGAFHGAWFRTGDMYVRDADGYYFQEGRADDMLKISGQWVSPAEIEDEVLKLPGVADAAVVGAANAEGLVRLALFVLPNDPGADPEALAAGIQKSLVERLSVYKCPREVRVVSEIPRTATGKVQRFKLRESVKAAGQ